MWKEDEEICSDDRSAVMLKVNCPKQLISMWTIISF